MTGISLVIVFILAIVFMIVAISKFKIHPFLSIMGVSLVLGIFAGIPLVDKIVDGNKVLGLANIIGSGFSSTFTSIGIVIILGALIGNILEKTGAALKLADMVIHLVGKKNPELAIELMGWIVSIPVFCDSGFVILNPIRRAIVQRSGVSSVAMSIALSCGLYISHVFIPPTPGPIAAANTLGVANNLLLVMGMGALCSIFPLIAGFVFAKFVCKREKAADEADLSVVSKSYDDIIKEYGKLPNGFLAIAPIIVPVILMALSSVVSVIHMGSFLADIILFLGTPIIALTVGALFGIYLIKISGKSSELYSLTESTLKTVGPILFVTAAGGVLGKVIAVSDMINFIKNNAETFKTIGIFFPFIIAAILKTAQGSSTVAITTSAGIVAPLLPVLGFTSPVSLSLVVMAIGCGAMTVSHANDSYFWVVTNFGAMRAEQGYRTQTILTLILGVAGMIEIYLLSMIF